MRWRGPFQAFRCSDDRHHIGLRLYADMEAELEAWIAARPDPIPSKPEAITRLLGETLRRHRSG